MNAQRLLEEKVEAVRQELYDAYSDGCSYEELLRISQKLDHLLNELSSTNKKINPL